MNLFKSKMTTDSLEFVILAAGRGTRNYPHSKGIPHKSLVPFGSQKVIDYLVKDIIAAGAKHITIVCSDESAKKAFQACFTHEKDVEDKFERKGNTLELELLKSLYLPENIDLKFVIQKQALGTGHAIGLVHNSISDKHRNIVMLWGDDIVLPDYIVNEYKTAPKTILTRAVERYLSDGYGGNLIATRKVKDPSRWGIVENGVYIEKPKKSKSNEAAFCFAIFDYKVTEKLGIDSKLIDEGKEPVYKDGFVGGEYIFIPALNATVLEDKHKQHLRTVKMKSDEIYLDCGSLAGYEKALIYSLLTSSAYAKENLMFIIKLYLRRKQFYKSPFKLLKSIFKSFINLKKIVRRS